MRVLLESPLQDMTEEMEIINFQLDLLAEAATGMSEDNLNAENLNESFSLFEDVETDELTIMNEEAWEMYNESLSQSLKSIWRMIVRFVKSIFVSSGMTITSEEAKKIVEIVNSASGDGAMDGKNMKKIVQKGFYLIAGLGSSLNGNELYRAYTSGDTTNFVMHNVKKLNVNSLPSGARFRVCLGVYDNAAKPNLALIKKTIDILSKEGVAGIEKLGKGGKADAKTESVELDPEMSLFSESKKSKKKNKGQGAPAADAGAGAGDGKAAETKPAESKSDEPVDFMARLQANPTGKPDPGPKKSLPRRLIAGAPTPKKVVAGGKQVVAGVKTYRSADALDEYDTKAQGMEMIKGGGKEVAKGAAVVAAGAALAAGIVYLVKRHNRAVRDGDGNKVAMATVTYINENKPDGEARIRLYDGTGKVSTLQVKGHDKVVALRDEICKVAEEMMNNGDRLDPGVRENVLEFASQINTFFAGLVTKGQKAE